MPIIENYSDHNFEFPMQKWEADGSKRNGGTKTLVFPKLNVETDAATGDAKQIPGTLEITDEELKLMQEHYVAKAWFDRNGLAVRAGRAAPAGKQR